MQSTAPGGMRGGIIAHGFNHGNPNKLKYNFRWCRSGDWEGSDILCYDDSKVTPTMLEGEGNTFLRGNENVGVSNNLSVICSEV